VKQYLKKILSKDKGIKRDCKYLIIPDLHGCYSIYKNIDKYIKDECEEDRIVIFLGDYMDRGESGKIFGREFNDAGSYHTINALIELRQWGIDNNRKLLFLRGNHEIFYEDYYFKDREAAYHQYDFFRDGVLSLDFAFYNDATLYPRFEQFFYELKPYHLDKKNAYLFVHAGVDFNEGSLKEQAKKGVIYWVRNRFIRSDQKLPYTVVFGHTPFENPFMRENRIGLDSGIYDSGFINLLKIDGNVTKFIKIEAST
jgi:serine/threonine protein phosphatase 1